MTDDVKTDKKKPRRVSPDSFGADDDLELKSSRAKVELEAKVSIEHNRAVYLPGQKFEVELEHAQTLVDAKYATYTRGKSK
jgi:hypothetical protein